MAKTLKSYFGLVVLFCFCSIYPIEVWSQIAAPQDISSPKVINRPSVGIDGAGNAVALWAQLDQLRNVNIQSADHPKGGNWSPPSTISSFKAPDSFFPNNVGNQIAVNASGDAVAVWVEINGDENNIVASTRKNNGNWSLKTLLGRTTTLFPRPAVAIDVSGNGVAIWVDDNGISSSTFLSIPGSWSNAQTVIQGTSNSLPQIGVDNIGQAVAIWFDSALNVVRSSFLSFLEPEPRWSTSINISRSNVDISSNNLSLATGGSSFTVAAWSTTDKKIEANTAFFSKSEFKWGENPKLIDSSQILRDANLTESQLKVAIDSSNNAIAIWANSQRVIKSSYLPSNGINWDPSLTVSSALPAENPQVAFDASGNAWAVWNARFSATARVIEDSFLAQGETTWSPVMTLSDSKFDSFEPQIAVDPASDAVVGWLSTVNNDDTTQRVQAAFILQPIVISITPNKGTVSGGNQVAIRGVHFNDVQSVTFGGVPATSFTVNSSTSITATVPPSANNQPKTVNVIVTTKNGSSPATVKYSYILLPIIDSLNPENGHAGDLVIINGKNFCSPDCTTVNFGTKPAHVFIIRSDQIIVRAPAQSDVTITKVNVTATTPNGTSNAKTFTYDAPHVGNLPNVMKVNPNSGPAKGGNTIMIKGTHFRDVSAVKFGNVDALKFKVISPKSIKAKVPPGVKGSTVDVTVTTDVGTSLISPLDQYSYKGASPKPPHHFVGVLFRKNRCFERAKFELEATWEPSPSPNVVEYRIYKKDVIFKTVRVDSSSSSSSSHLFFATTVHSRKAAQNFSIASVDGQGVESRRIKLRIVND